MEDLRLIMNLSSIITGVPEYIEFGWVTSPNAAEQTITGNTLTELTINKEVADSAGIVSDPISNKFTIPAGTYYFEAHSAVFFENLTGGFFRAIFSLRKSDGSYITRQTTNGKQSELIKEIHLNGQFTITAQTTMSLYLLCNNPVDIGIDTPVFTSSTDGQDQRTTIKLWKLK